MPASRSSRNVGLGVAPELPTTTPAAPAARSTSRGSLKPVRAPRSRAASRAERAADLLERLRVGIAVEPVAELEDVPLALGQLREGAVQHLLLEAHVHLLLDALVRGGDDVAELRPVVVADWLVEARNRARGLAHLAHLFQRQLRDLRDLLLGGVALEL